MLIFNARFEYCDQADLPVSEVESYKYAGDCSRLNCALLKNEINVVAGSFSVMSFRAATAICSFSAYRRSYDHNRVT